MQGSALGILILMFGNVAPADLPGQTIPNSQQPT